MDNNGFQYRAYLVSEYLKIEGIIRMDWPTYLPEFNSIVHVRNALGHRLSSGQILPLTLQELKTTLLEKWRGILKDLINTLITFMKSTCEVCISVRDENISH